MTTEQHEPFDEATGPLPGLLPLQQPPACVEPLSNQGRTLDEKETPHDPTQPLAAFIPKPDKQVELIEGFKSYNRAPNQVRVSMSDDTNIWTLPSGRGPGHKLVVTEDAYGRLDVERVKVIQ